MNPVRLPIPAKNRPLYASHFQRMFSTTERTASFMIDHSYRGGNPAIACTYGPLRISLLLMLVATLIMVVFGALVPVDSAAIAKGKVVVLSKRKTVQHLEGGIIKSILVRDGDVVKEGQPLLEISDITPKANRSIVQTDLWMERASEARLLGLQNNRQYLDFPEEIVIAAQHQPDLASTLQAQEELFITQRKAHASKLKMLAQRISESKEEITGLKAQIKSAQAQLVYINEEIGTVKKLLRDGLATRPRLLALQRDAEELKGSVGQNTAMIARAEQGITEIEMQIASEQHEFAERIAGEIKDVRSRISEYKEKLSAVTDIMERTVVTAPTEGIVTGLQYHTIGGVIEGGAAIMDIVPQNEQLVLDVKIQPTDIDVVRPGLESRIIFPAYKARRMPLLKGTVSQVSADAFIEKQGMNDISYYTARVEVDTSQVKDLDMPVSLYPGMPADVYIKTGERSFIGYLLAPVTDSMARAFKEK